MLLLKFLSHAEQHRGDSLALNWGSLEDGDDRQLDLRQADDQFIVRMKGPQQRSASRDAALNVGRAQRVPTLSRCSFVAMRFRLTSNLQSAS